MFPNTTCEISNYVIEPDGRFYNLYLSPEKQAESGIERCLAAAGTVNELIAYILNKQGDLHDTDILIGFLDSSTIQLQYYVIPAEESFILYENINNQRKPIDEDQDIDRLVVRHTDKNMFLQF
jgi:hypothetical protein